MKLSELKSILETYPDSVPRFVLPGGGQVPEHYHLTEVGHVAKKFIDCGGTMRQIDNCVLQLWATDSDKAHRLDAAKFRSILALGQTVLPDEDLDVEVEYDDYAISQFSISSVVISGTHIDFALTTKHTDCLAREKCGVGANACCETTAASCC